jgi:hypothetical protein
MILEDEQPTGDNPLLDAAAQAVADGLDAYDKTLIAGVAKQAPDSTERRSLELAFAHRIVAAALALGAAIEDLIDPPCPQR